MYGNFNEIMMLMSKCRFRRKTYTRNLLPYECTLIVSDYLETLLICGLMTQSQQNNRANPI